MQRRKFIKLVGWGAVTWPLAVHAQQPTKMRRIGLLRANPVMFPPGRDRFLTRPPMNGSAADAVTIGMVLLTATAARTATVPSVTIISTP
jgi:hypothetical protein